MASLTIDHDIFADARITGDYSGVELNKLAAKQAISEGLDIEITQKSTNSPDVIIQTLKTDQEVDEYWASNNPK